VYLFSTHNSFFLSFKSPLHSANDINNAVPLFTQKSYSPTPPLGLGLHGSITVNWKEGLSLTPVL